MWLIPGLLVLIVVLIFFRCRILGHTWNGYVWGSRCNWCDKIKGI